MIEAKPAIDLTRHAWVRELGDLTVFGTWLYNADQEDTEPCLVIIPRYRARGTYKPAVIPLSSAFRYNDPAHLARAAAVFAKNMGFEDMVSAHKLANLIYDHLGDLISIPVDPMVATVAADATITFGNGRKRSIEMLEYVQER